MALEGAGDTSLLLGKGDVPPIHEDNAAGQSPFLLTSDHYGRLIPRVLGDLGVPLAQGYYTGRPGRPWPDVRVARPSAESDRALVAFETTPAGAATAGSLLPI